MNDPSGNSLLTAFNASHQRWSFTEDMIKRILSLIQGSRWIRNYLLNEGRHREQDAHILASLEHRKHSNVRACICDEAEYTQILLPAFSDGEVGAGVVAEYPTNTAFSFSCRTARFAVDIKKGSNLFVYNDPGSKRVDILFLIPNKTQGTIVNLNFDRSSFIDGIRHDEINYEIIHRSLLFSRYTVLQNRTTSERPDDNLYPFPVPEIFGQLLKRHINVCAYANTLPLMAFTKHMGCFQRRVDPRSFFGADFNLDRSKRLGVSSLLQNPSARTPVPIAPAPMLTPRGVLTSEIEQDGLFLSSAARKQRRKIKKRESAARSYARKREKRIAAMRDTEASENNQESE